MQMAREVSQLRAQQVRLRAVVEGDIQRAASDAASGTEGLQLRWRQVLPRQHPLRKPCFHMYNDRSILSCWGE